MEKISDLKKSSLLEKSILLKYTWIFIAEIDIPHTGHKNLRWTYSNLIELLAGKTTIILYFLYFYIFIFL